MAERLCALIPNFLERKFIDLMYPVGRWVYQDTNPQDAYPWQTWEQAKDVFLLAAGSKAAGSTGGEETHKLTTAEMPSHNHTASSGSAGGHTHTATTSSAGAHTHTATTSSAGAHTHTMHAPGITPSQGNAGTVSGNFKMDEHWHVIRAVSGTAYPDGYGYGTYSIPSSGAHTHSLTTSSNGAHTHTLTTSNAGAHTHTVTVNSNGSGAAHNNMPPYRAVNLWHRIA